MCQAMQQQYYSMERRLHDTRTEMQNRRMTVDLFSSHASEGGAVDGRSGNLVSRSLSDGQCANRPGSYYAPNSDIEKENLSQENGNRRRTTMGGNYLPRNARSPETTIRRNIPICNDTRKKTSKSVCAKSTSPIPDHEVNREMVDNAQPNESDGRLVLLKRSPIRPLGFRRINPIGGKPREGGGI